MKIFVANDDGVFAPGISVLVDNLLKAGHRPLVVAPDRERSSVGHAITLTRPLRLWSVKMSSYDPVTEVYACDGTPSDCVALGLEEKASDADIMISGINNGPNLADDLTYSGTVSAAMEGAILGYPAIAVSLNCSRGDVHHYYDSAGLIVVKILEWLSRFPLEKGIILNVNVPNLPFSDIKGLKITHKGVRVYADKLTRIKDPSGREYYWMAGKPEDEMVEGTDVWAVAHGYVSVTPIHMDMTHYKTLKNLRSGNITDII